MKPKDFQNRLTSTDSQKMSDTDEPDDDIYFETSTLITGVSLKHIQKLEASTDFAQVYSKMALQTKSFKFFSNEEKLQATNNKNKLKDEHNYVIREILTTEETFLNIMKILIEDFLRPLSKVMTQEERRITSINIGRNITLIPYNKNHLILKFN